MKLLPLILYSLLLGACAAAPPHNSDVALAPIDGLARDPHLLARSPFSPAPQRLALDLYTGRPGAESAILQWLRINSDASREDRSGLWLLVCEERYRRSTYAAAISACEEAGRLKPHAAKAFLAFLQPLGATPPMQWSGPSATLPLFKDSDGNRRVLVSDVSGPIEAVVDTGAETTVVMESVARQLGARPLGSGKMGTTTTPVTGQLAVIERIKFGSAEIRWVPVMVLPDAQLTFPDGTSLPMVLGLAVLTSAGKAAFLQHGRILALGRSVPSARGQPVPLYWDPSGIGFEARFMREPRAVHFDTGSRRNYLFPTSERSLSEAEKLTKRPFERKIAGIGGERTEQAFQFETVTIWVAGHPWTFSPMEMAPEDDEGEAARIGSPMMDRFETIILDFDRMQMFVS